MSNPNLVLLLPLTDEQRERLVTLVAAEATTIEARRALLENAGLDALIPKLTLNATGKDFAVQLLRVLQQQGRLAATKAPALTSLLLELRERFAGQQDVAAFIQELLAVEAIVAEPPAEPLTPPVRFSRLQIATGGSLTLVLILAAFVTIAQAVNAARPKAVEPMPAGFNVLVAGFGAVDSSGKPVESSDALAVSEQFAGRLERAIQTNLSDAPDAPHVRYIADSPLRTTSDPAVREAIAQRLMGEHKAHILVYGRVQLNEESEFAPFNLIFYANYLGFERERTVIDGENALGMAFPVPIPFNTQFLQGNAESDLEVRSSALSLMVIGLSYDAQSQHERALLYYDRALSLSGWNEQGEGKEIAYLLAGNAAGKIASVLPGNSAENLELIARAERYYLSALASNAHYGRAMIGLSGIRKLQWINLLASDGAEAAQFRLKEVEVLLEAAILPENDVRGALVVPLT